MPLPSVVRGTALAVLLFVARQAVAQCPDGTAPPCAASRRVAVARAVPSPEARARRFILLPFRNVTRLAAQEASYQAERTTLLAQVEDLHTRLVETDADRTARGELIERQSAVLAEQGRILAKRSVKVLRKLRLA